MGVKIKSRKYKGRTYQHGPYRTKKERWGEVVVTYKQVAPVEVVQEKENGGNLSPEQ